MANNGKINIRLMPGQDLPEGWQYGMIHSEKRHHRSFSWCNNGEIDKRYNPSKGLPDGFKPGRIGGPGFSVINSVPSEIRREWARKNDAKANLSKKSTDGRPKGKSDQDPT